MHVVKTDLDGVMHGAKAAFPHLEETDDCIINTASIYELVGAKSQRPTPQRRAAS